MSGERVKLSRIGWWWLGISLASVLVSCLLGWFDDSTELLPDHSDLLEYGFWVACIAAVGTVVLVLFQSSGPWFRRLGLIIVGAPLIAFLGVFLLSMELITLVSAHADFPARQTRRFDAILMVDRAYQTNGKGRSWNIQTTPIWSNIDITEADYNYMLGHRRPDDQTSDKDEIASRGYFCAKVVAEQAGAAIRVMNAGRYTLPRGTIGICSAIIAADPALPIIGEGR